MTRDGTRVLFDPFLEWCPRPPAAPDVICVSHGHLDHFAAVPDLVRGDSPAQVVAALLAISMIFGWMRIT